MIFAKIDFINLLPFHIFIKKNIQSSQLKAIIEYKKSIHLLLLRNLKNEKLIVLLSLQLVQEMKNF